MHLSFSFPNFSQCLPPTTHFTTTSCSQPKIANRISPLNFHLSSTHLGGIIKNMDGIAHAVGGVSDHVHLLVSLTPNHRISDVMRELKSDSSLWIKKQIHKKTFAWQEGYGVFTVSPSSVENVRHYVNTQEEHHKKTSFQDEYLSFLQRGMVEYDEKYLW